MAIVPYPTRTNHQSVGVRPVAATRMNRSVLTGARQALDMGYSWWEAEVAVAQMPLDEARAWRLFFGRLRGGVNTFRLPIVRTDQHVGTFIVRANGVGSGYSMSSDGWPVSSTTLFGGDYVTVGDQLMVLDQNVVANGSGVATLYFHSPLRKTVADNTVITTKRPYLMSFISSDAPALVLPTVDLQNGFSYSASEAY